MSPSVLRKVPRYWFWLSALLLGLAFVSIALTPVTLSVDRGVSQQAVTDGTWEEVPRAVPSRVTVRAPEGGFVYLAQPQLRWPEAFSEELVKSSRGFRVTPSTGGFVSKEGGTLVFRGVFSSFSLELLPGTTVESVSVTRRSLDRVTRSRLLSGDSISLQSPARSYQRTTSFLWRSVPVRLDRPEGTTLKTSIGNYHTTTFGENHVAFGTLATKSALIFLQGLSIFIISIILVLFGWAVARMLDPTGKSSLRWLSLQAVAGVSLVALMCNSLAYFLSTQWIAWLILVLGLGILAWRLIFQRVSLKTLFPVTRLSKSLGLALIPTLFMFFPVLHWGGWYAGRYNTDLFEYVHLSSLLRENSLFALRGSSEALNSGILTSGAGFEWRSIDSVIASVASILTFSSSVTGLVIVSIAIFLLFGISLIALLSRRRKWSLCLALLLLLSPMFVALFIENYQSHYFFIAFIPGLVLSLHLLLESEGLGSRSRRLYLYLLISSILGATLAAYPYFAAVVAIGLGLVLALFLRHARTIVRTLSAIAVTTLGVLNIGAFSFIYLKNSATRYQAGLDEIALGVLLEPFSPSQLASAALGTTPYIWRPVGEAQPYLGWLGGTIWSFGDEAWSPGALEVLSVLLFIGVFLLAFEWRSSLKDPKFLGSFVVVASFIGLTGLFALRDSPYSALKVGWTASALLPLIVASAYFKPRWELLVTIAIVPLALFWIRTDLLDRSNWLISRDGTFSSLSHSSLQPTLFSIRNKLEAKPDLVTVIRGQQPIFDSDRDRVLFSHVRAMVRELDLDCLGCEGYGLDPSRLPYRSKCSSSNNVIVRIGVSGNSKQCGNRLEFLGPAVEVYGSTEPRTSSG